MQIGLERAQTLYKTDRRRFRLRFLLSLLLLAALFVVYLHLGYDLRFTPRGFLSPGETLSNLFLAAKLKVAEKLHLPFYNLKLELIRAHTGYDTTMARLEGGVRVMALGGVLAAAGVAFQSVFRNPIAMPTMLGVSSGINIANLLLVLQFSTAAAYMSKDRFIYGYLCSLGLLGVVMIFGRLAGGKRSSVTDILLVGSCLSRVLSQVVNGFQFTYLEETDYLLLRSMSMYGVGLGSSNGDMFLFVAVLLGLLPLIFLRYSMNVMTYPDEEARCLGLRAGWLRLLILLCSTILVVVTQIYTGEVGMLAMLVPHMCRRLFGCNTRELLIGSMVYGAIILLICRMVVAVISLVSLTLSFISVGLLVDLISMPLLILTLLRHRRGWS